MKKLLISTLLMSAFGVAGAPAFAAGTDQAPVHVYGHIEPEGCDVQIADDGVFDYGAMTAAGNSLSATAITSLSAKTNRVTVSCKANAKIQLSLSDNAAGTVLAGTNGLLGETATTTNRYGLGLDDKGAQIGAYAISLTPTSVTDLAGASVAGTLLTSPDGTVWTAASALNAPTTFKTDTLMSWGTAPAPAALQIFVGDLKVQAALAPQQSLAKDYDLNGSAILTVKVI
ncbi:DUF1120 domain-containing protein [Pandoraea sputorum]|uniref:DUF1120 domain-containing protein n=1 Tax=Pandoraea sputorum TaxID=93222 RepID=A0A5E5ARU8_9BURK|nr:DUF1120 domain-containing protein [Pandoraea sputorum]VVE75737.1 hypothetical protein PSP31121_00587 [Pandoraea sputorum]